jgi:glycosyltransferase involved in cell wall biosynthesis
LLIRHLPEDLAKYSTEPYGFGEMPTLRPTFSLICEIRHKSRLAVQSFANYHLDSPMAHINLISYDNSAGLTQDMKLMANALRAMGHDIATTPLGHRSRPGSRLRRLRARLHRNWWPSRFDTRYNFNIMLEHVRPELFAQARFNLLMPNPEWFRSEWLPELKHFDLVLAKTRHAERIFRKLGCRTHWTGFTCQDNFLPDVPRAPTFFHGPGRSNNKGTLQLLALWEKHPEWPQLTVVWRHDKHAEISLPPNITLIRDYLDAGELRRLQNASIFHLCPSQTEGYGHSIAESLSVGAVVISTNAEPMNELVTAERGVLVPAHAQGTQQLATLYDFDPASMEMAITRCLAMPPEEQRDIGRAARKWSLANRQDFQHRLRDALAVGIGRG